jgi:hypothetical protein
LLTSVDLGLLMVAPGCNDDVTVKVG